MSEWIKELVLKTSDSQEPWVRIPLPAPCGIGVNGSTSVFQTESAGSNPVCHSIISGCSPVGRARDLGSRGRLFESGHPDQMLE